MVVGDVQGRYPLGVQEITDVCRKAISQIPVEGTEGLIKQEQAWRRCQCPGERDALCLPS